MASLDSIFYFLFQSLNFKPLTYGAVDLAPTSISLLIRIMRFYRNNIWIKKALVIIHLIDLVSENAISAVAILEFEYGNTGLIFVD